MLPGFKSLCIIFFIAINLNTLFNCFVISLILFIEKPFSLFISFFKSESHNSNTKYTFSESLNDFINSVEFSHSI